MTASTSGESTVKFKQTTGSFCSYHDFTDYLFFLLLGVLGGLLGALFNQIVEHLNHLRGKHINPYITRRLLEVAAICLLTGTAAVLLPAMFACQSEVGILHPSVPKRTQALDQ